MKFLRSFLCALALLAAAQAATVKELSFAAPVDASHYNTAAGTVTKIRLLTIDYEAGIYRFQLVNAAGQVVSNGAVFGVADSTPDESRVIAQVLAAIQAAG